METILLCRPETAVQSSNDDHLLETLLASVRPDSCGKTNAAMC